jgi:hypothetical protein
MHLAETTKTREAESLSAQRRYGVREYLPSLVTAQRVADDGKVGEAKSTLQRTIEPSGRHLRSLVTARMVAES